MAKHIFGTHRPGDGPSYQDELREAENARLVRSNGAKKDWQTRRARDAELYARIQGYANASGGNSASAQSAATTNRAQEYAQSLAQQNNFQTPRGGVMLPSKPPMSKLKAWWCWFRHGE